MTEKYNPKYIEPKWKKYWEENPDLQMAKDNSEQEKKYILDMFPYPSGDGLHVGHVEGYTATDIYSRYNRMRGYNVLHPMGWDAFGLPAENYAIKTGEHPDKSTHQNIKNFTQQIKSLGLSYDWSREIDSSSPEYYKWTQWFFLLLYKNGLAYKKKAKVNWCESCKTVLANEQVEDGKCERCKNPVMQKDLEQWFFKITDFVEDRGNTSGLISGLNKIDWPESTKAAQKNWIGRSEGAIAKFEITTTPAFSHPSSVEEGKGEVLNEFVEVFTTRVDTIFGCTYVVVAPEHSVISNLKSQISNFSEVENYLKETKKKSDLDRMEAKEKTGVEIKGIKVTNPFNGEELPLYVADYVLSQYGTGAVMAVPAHDERDFEFAKKYELPIREVISGNKNEKGICVDDGVVFDSEKFSNTSSSEAREKMMQWLEENNLGSKKVNYRLRDWLVSRQRYWGAPIPIIYCDKCGEVAVPESDLPVKLSTDVDFKPTGESPLVYSESFHNVKCPKCGGKARRESDTMDTFVCSSWYYFRYADPKNEKEFAARDLIKRWLPVDVYVGGAEHTVLHLLYARFFTKALHSLGLIDFDEPFLKLRHQGLIMAEDGRKMSKSLGNVISPDDEIEKWGADSLRLFEMFMGSLEDVKPWNTKGIVGVYRFLEKAWKMQDKIKTTNQSASWRIKLQSSTHKTIKKVGEDIDNFRFNTAISALMILVNEMEKQEFIQVADYELLIKILSPFAPFISEELWNKLGHAESIFKESWPEYDAELIKDEEIELVVQINGKVRDKIMVGADISEEEAKKLALESEKVKNYISGKEIKKIIFIKGKLVNIVI